MNSSYMFSLRILRPYQDRSTQENLPEWSKNSLESNDSIPGMTLKTWRGNFVPEYWMSPWFGQLHLMPHPCFSDKCLERYLMLEGCHRAGEKQGWFSYLCLIRAFMRIKSDNVQKALEPSQCLVWSKYLVFTIILSGLAERNLFP